MDVKWSPHAEELLDGIVIGIATALSIDDGLAWESKLRAASDQLADFPNLGTVIPLVCFHTVPYGSCKRQPAPPDYLQALPHRVRTSRRRNPYPLHPTRTNAYRRRRHRLVLSRSIPFAGLWNYGNEQLWNYGIDQSHNPIIP